MASLPNSDPSQPFMTAEELLAIRGTPEFDVEYRRQKLAIAEQRRKRDRSDASDFLDWSVPGWTYDAEL